MSGSKATLKAYLGLALLIVAARAALTFFPVQTAFAAQALAVSWPATLLVLILGYSGLFLAPRAGFPPLRDPEISAQQRFLWPVMAGMGAGLFTIIWDAVYVLPRDLNVSFPRSIPFYLLGAFFVEVVQHLLPIVVLTVILTRVLSGRVGRETVFWVAALLVAAVEPATQFGSGLFSSYPAGFFILGIALTYAINLLQLVLFRRRGFLAMLTFRWGFYAVWHVIWGPLRLEILFA